ncbi:uncharacterized protein LOC124500080 [Dermatophagoides farinae]|uniref:uncharacterized protein LOC124500080 n=1 Tax=Dermatophagoides farinae TaxID=6954 RepID=UPI003F5FB42E
MAQSSNISSRMFCVLLIMLSSHFICSSFAAATRKYCQTSNDCNENQCCIETPIGWKFCLDYEQSGETCFYRYRTPTCGCARGLKCVSTSPMQPGDWNHDYICARVRPFQYHKLVPYFNDENHLYK